MNKIILDLEFTKVDANRKGVLDVCQFEVIQIGAVRLGEDDEVVDRFNMYVKPRYSHIDAIVEGLTGITNEMVKSAPYFDQAFTAFLEWVGDDEFVIFSWGNDDKVIMQKEVKLCAVKDNRTKKMFDSWINLQAVVGQILEVKNQLSLEKTLNAGNIEITGRMHCAVDDAENTAKIYRLAQDEDSFKDLIGDKMSIVEESEYKDTHYSTASMTYSMAGLFEGFVCRA